MYEYVPDNGDDEDDDGDERAELGHPQFRVALCSGEEITVRTEQERRWLEATRGSYLEQNRFTEVTDLQDVDRLLVLELSIFRWTQYLSSGFDYDRNLIDEELIRKQIKEGSAEITRVKASLGLDKKARNAALNEGNFAAWIESVRERARIFGVHRENQLSEALILMNELTSIIGIYDRSDEEERKKLGYETEGAILEWIRAQMLPKYHELDEHFAARQRLWAKDL